MFKDKNIIIFAAHPDDVECGMGGTLNQLAKYNPKVVVMAGTVQNNGDKIKEELKNSMKTQKVSYSLHSFEVDNLEKDKVEIRKIIYSYRDADIIFAPSKRSQHQDHRLIGEAVDDIMLEKTIFYYEDIRSGQNEHINFWNSLSEEDMEAADAAATKDEASDKEGKDEADEEKGKDEDKKKKVSAAKKPAKKAAKK